MGDLMWSGSAWFPLQGHGCVGSGTLYGFPVDCCDNHYMFSGLKRKFNLTILEVRSGSQAVSTVDFLYGGSRRESISFPFSASRSCLRFLAGGQLLSSKLTIADCVFPTRGKSRILSSQDP